VARLNLNVLAEGNTGPFSSDPKNTNHLVVRLVSTPSGSDEQAQFVMLHATRIIVYRDELPVRIQHHVNGKSALSSLQGPQIDRIIEEFAHARAQVVIANDRPEHPLDGRAVERSDLCLACNSHV